MAVLPGLAFTVWTLNPTRECVRSAALRVSWVCSSPRYSPPLPCPESSALQHLWRIACDAWTYLTALVVKRFGELTCP